MDGGTEQKHLIFSEGQGPGFSDIFLHGYDTKITPIISHKSICPKETQIEPIITCLGVYIQIKY